MDIMDKLLNISCSYWLGYILTHIPGGLLVQNFGGKYVFGLGITISAFCSMAIPLAVEYGVDNEFMILYFIFSCNEICRRLACHN